MRISYIFKLWKFRDIWILFFLFIPSCKYTNSLLDFLFLMISPAATNKQLMSVIYCLKISLPKTIDLVDVFPAFWVTAGNSFDKYLAINNVTICLVWSNSFHAAFHSGPMPNNIF